MIMQIKNTNGDVIYGTDYDVKIAIGGRYKWVGHNFGQLKLEHADLVGMFLSYTLMLPDSGLEQCDLSDITLHHAYSEKVRYQSCTLDRSEFDGAILNGAIFDQCRMFETSFINASLIGAVFMNCVFDKEIDFSLANLQGVCFYLPENKEAEFIKSVDFTGANLADATINDKDLIDLIMSTK